MNSKVASEQYMCVAIFNMMRGVSTEKSLSTAEYTLYSAVDKDIDKGLAMIFCQVTTRLLTGYILVAFM